MAWYRNGFCKWSYTNRVCQGGSCNRALCLWLPIIKDTFDCIPKFIILYDVTLLRDKLHVRDTCTCNLNCLLSKLMTYAYINILLSFRDCLAFATEPIFASLANILGKHDNMPSQISPEFKVDISSFCLVHVVCKEWVYIASVWAASQILVPYSNCNHQNLSIILLKRCVVKSRNWLRINCQILFHAPLRLSLKARDQGLPLTTFSIHDLWLLS